MRLILLSLLVPVLALAAPAPVERPLKPGETIDSIAAQAYGSKHYGALLALFNGLKKGSKPKSVKVPTLDDGLRAAALPHELEGVTLLVSAASARLRGVGVELEPLRPKKAGATVALTAPLLLRLRTVQTDLSQSASALGLYEQKLTPDGAEIPDGLKPVTAAMAKLAKASASLEQVAQGKLDPKGDDLEAAHAQIAGALEDGLRWSAGTKK
ncbi:MAG: hypothetical protein ACJ790_21295 [Myxococcaceae bacterium]